MLAQCIQCHSTLSSIPAQDAHVSYLTRFVAVLMNIVCLQRAAHESKTAIEQALQGTDMVFVTVSSQLSFDMSSACQSLTTLAQKQ